MSSAIRDFCTFLLRCTRLLFEGDWRYYLWTGSLFAVCLVGLNAYARQLVDGLVVTGMTDQVSWGVYIANFTFLVGVAAAAVMLVIPVYIYKNEHLHDLVIFGELLAVAAILMCLAFVTVDLGRPDRFWHMIPGWGRLNFPRSLLAWDVIVLNGYLVVNVYICAYLLYCRYRKQTPNKWLYMPVVYLGIVWAVSIHTVTAFLYVGLGGRPFWNSSIVGPRFIASAFTAGPALIILALQVIRRVTSDAPDSTLPTVGSAQPLSSRPATLNDNLRHQALQRAEVIEVPAGRTVLHQGYQRLMITDHGLLTLRGIVQVSMLINVFLLLNEVFKEFYTDNLHVAASQYLFFGLYGHHALVPWIWTAIGCNLVALVLLLLPVTRSLRWLDLACVLAIVGIWIEKGMGLVVPGFIPSPLGEIVEYTPSLNETLVCFGIWAFGILCYTLLLRVAVPILQGRLTRNA